MCSDLGLFWQYTTYMFSLRSWIDKAHTQLHFDQMCGSNYKEGRSWKFPADQPVWERVVPVCQGPPNTSPTPWGRNWATQKQKLLKRRFWTGKTLQSPHVCVCVCIPLHTLCASRRSDGCCQTQFCLFPSYHQGHPPPSFCSCSPCDGNTRRIHNRKSPKLVELILRSIT